MGDEVELDREIAETRARLAGLENTRRHARGGWTRGAVVAVVAAVSVIVGIGSFVGGRTSVDGELRSARIEADRAAASNVELGGTVDQLQEENRSLQSEVAAAEAATSNARLKLDTYKEAMSWCGSAADNINNFAWSTGLAWLPSDTTDMIYRQINKCLRPTGHHYG